MKFLSCYIAGFGKFIDRSFDFSEGVNVLKENNGWGKTTLAVFLKCMLYGMDGGRSKSLHNNERAKYYPWKGDRFGGSLTFSYRDRTYRVERTFGKTAAGDDIRIYDQNHAPCYEFGEKPMRLGEYLFGLDAESYERSVYIPQGEVQADGLPDTMKNRLLALLSATYTDGSATKALDLLDKAERALQAKRKPGKGKIDLLEDRLLQIARERAASAQFETKVKELSAELPHVKNQIAQALEQKQQIDQRIEEKGKAREERARTVYVQNATARMAELKARTSEFCACFSDGIPDPNTMRAMCALADEFYEHKQRLEQTEATLRDLQTRKESRSMWEAKRDTAKKTLDSYREIGAIHTKTNGAGMRRNKKTLRVFAAAFGVGALCVGGALLKSVPVVGGLLLVAGLLGLVCAVIGRKKARAEDEGQTTMPNLAKAYEETLAQWQQADAALRAFPTDLDEQIAVLSTERENTVAILQQEQTRLDRFFAPFLPEKSLDYRAAGSIMQERAHVYTAACSEIRTLQSALQNAENTQFAQPIARDEEETALFAQKDRIEQDLRALFAYRERLQTELENCENRNHTADLDAEDERLRTEKARLEKRLQAVRTAREFLVRAQENLATRYLDPVMQKCREYLQTMGAGMGTLRFSVDGTPLFEENGTLREIAYYSEGMQGLVGFCMRVALAETVFSAEKPCLILDDPFTDLDDEKTEQAKRFVRMLSQRYQILYLTCKRERKL